MSAPRIGLAQAVAAVAALLLLLVMAMDWYTTERAEDLRRDARLTEPGRTGGGEFEPNLKRERESAAEKDEKNAWQAGAAVDRLALVLMLAAAGSALVAAILRAADRRFEPPRSWSSAATALGLAAAVLVVYRILQPPGLNEAAVVKIGAPLGLLLLGTLAFASRVAMRGEREEPALAGEPAEGADDALPPPSGEPVEPAAP